MTKFLIVCAIAFNSAMATASELPDSSTTEPTVGYECENAYAKRSQRLADSAIRKRRLAAALTAAGAAGVVYGIVKKKTRHLSFMIPLGMTAASAVVTARFSVRAFEEESLFDYDMSRAIYEARSGQLGPATARLTNTLNAAIYHEGSAEDLYLASRMEVDTKMRGELKARLEYEKLGAEQVFSVMQVLTVKGDLCTATNKPMILKNVASNIFGGLLQTPGVLQP